MKVSFKTEFLGIIEHVYYLFVECRPLFDTSYVYSIKCLSYDSNVPFCLSLFNISFDDKQNVDSIMSVPAPAASKKGA